VATSSQIARAIQKKTSERVRSDRRWVCSAVAYVAEEYMPNGKTPDHQTPAKCSDPRLRSTCQTSTYSSTGIHRLARTHKATVAGWATSRSHGVVPRARSEASSWSPARVPIASAPNRIQLSGVICSETSGAVRARHAISQVTAR